MGGCGEARDKPSLSRKIITVDQVPEEVLAAAKKALPGVDFSDGWQNIRRDGTLDSYEIRGRNQQGKIREARVSPSGEILETE